MCCRIGAANPAVAHRKKKSGRLEGGLMPHIRGGSKPPQILGKIEGPIWSFFGVPNSDTGFSCHIGAADPAGAHRKKKIKKKKRKVVV